MPSSALTGSDHHVVLGGLGKNYDESGRNHAVLSGVDAHIATGEFVVLVGRSGSGKSTLLNLIGGLDKPSSGSVHIHGQDLYAMDETRRTLLRRRDMGFVFQFFNLIPTLTVLENVRLPAELNGADETDATRTASSWVDAVGLAGREDAYPDELSGGEQQRVAVARALVHRPGLVLADEPTGNLDIDTARIVLGLLDELCRDAGATLVMATHSPDVIGLADRVLAIRDGGLVDTRDVIDPGNPGDP